MLNLTAAEGAALNKLMAEAYKTHAATLPRETLELIHSINGKLSAAYEPKPFTVIARVNDDDVFLYRVEIAGPMDVDTATDAALAAYVEETGEKPAFIHACYVFEGHVETARWA